MKTGRAIGERERTERAEREFGHLSHYGKRKKEGRKEGRKEAAPGVASNTV